MYTAKMFHNSVLGDRIHFILKPQLFRYKRLAMATPVA